MRGRAVSQRSERGVVCGAARRPQVRSHAVLHCSGGALTGKAIQQLVLVLGVRLQSQLQLLDGVGRHLVQLDGNAQPSDHLAQVRVLGESPLDSGMMTRVQQRQEKLLLDVQVREQTMLELAPSQL